VTSETHGWSDGWSAFLNSLATRGGAIFILTFIVFFADFGGFVMYLRHDVTVDGLAKIVTGSGLFAGALLIVLKGSTDSSATATGPAGTVSASSAPLATAIPEPTNTSLPVQTVQTAAGTIAKPKG